jgi:hypothetical protein
MIRDGDVGHWPGYDAMRYALLASPEEAAAARAALAEPPTRMTGWEPPGTVDAEPPAPEVVAPEPAPTPPDQGPPAVGEGAPAPAEPQA